MIVFICLPDDAAKEAVAMYSNPDTAIICTPTPTAPKRDGCWAFRSCTACAKGAPWNSSRR